MNWKMALKLEILFNQISLYHRLLKHHCQRLTYIYYLCIYQHPLNTGHITPLPSNPIKYPFSRYNPNKKCEHHDGILDHLIKNSENFRYQAWNLENKGQVEFVKDNVIYYIITRSSWVQQVVGKY